VKSDRRKQAIGMLLADQFAAGKYIRSEEKNLVPLRLYGQKKIKN
jgi:hypothetical protein